MKDFQYLMSLSPSHPDRKAEIRKIEKWWEHYKIEIAKQVDITWIGDKPVGSGLCRKCMTKPCKCK